MVVEDEDEGGEAQEEVREWKREGVGEEGGGGGGED